MVNETMKLTISLPKPLVIFADKMAKQKNITRSKLVSMCLEDEIQRQKIEAMKEGYLVMSKEHAEFALLAEDLASETVPEWK